MEHNSYGDFAPACAVCGAPPHKRCACEFSSLVAAVEESEQRVLSKTWDDIRRWVTERATRAIQADYHQRSSLRRAKFDHYIAANRHRLSSQDMDDLRYNLQTGIDSDWRAAVARYPEVLDHYNTEAMRAIRTGAGVQSVIGRRSR